MRILIIKQLFYPEPTARSLDFALELSKNGHTVQVLTGFPSYPEGKIYPGYKQKFIKKETIQGIEVIRIPIIPDQSERAVFRIINYLSYAIAASFIGLWYVKKHDIAFAYHGALPVGIPAMINKIFRKTPFVYDINDLWPDTLVATGMLKNKFILRIVDKWCKITYNSAKHLTVLSNGFKEKLASRGVNKDKISIIHHWSRDKALDKDQKIPNNILAKFNSGHFHILYAGNIGLAQSLDNVIKAFEILEHKYPAIHFHLLGDGVERQNLIDLVQKKSLSNIHFLDRVDSSEVAKYLSCTDALLVHLKDEPLFRITIPSKIIAYLNAGKPILLGLKGDAQEIIEESNAGVVFQPDNAEDLAQKITQLYQMSPQERTKMSENAKQYYFDHFTIEENTKKYIHLMEEIVNER